MGHGNLQALIHLADIARMTGLDTVTDNPASRNKADPGGVQQLKTLRHRRPAPRGNQYLRSAQLMIQGAPPRQTLVLRQEIEINLLFGRISQVRAP